MNVLFKSLLILILYFSVRGVSIAQEVPKTIQFKQTDYDAGHQNWMVTQDCKGYLYVANSKGILTYNGFRWQLTTLPRNQTPRAVYLGQDCRIFTGGYESFGYIDVSDRSQPFYVSLADSLLQGTSQEIWNIFGDKDQIIFQTFSNIYKYNYKVNSQIITPSNIMLGKLVNDQLYIPKIEQGLYLIEADTIIEIPIAGTLPKKAKIADLCASNEDQDIVLGTQHEGLFLLKKNKLEAISGNLNKRLKNEQINKIIRLSSGSFAIGTILNGIYITDDFQSIKYHINKSNGLSNNTILSLYEDQNKDLWVGLDKGLNLIKLSDPLTYLYDRQGKLGTIFTSEYYNNSLYLGTNQGLFKSNPDGSFTLINNSQGQIWSFLLMGDDLICGHNSGTYLIKDNDFIQISDVTGGWCMEAISENRVLQSTYTGFVILSKKNGVWGLETKVKKGNILVEKFVRTGNIIVGYHVHYGICLLRFSENFDEVLEQVTFDKIDSLDIHDNVKLLTSNQDMILWFNDKLYKVDWKGIRALETQEISLLEKDRNFTSQYRFYQSLAEISRFENISNHHFNRIQNNDSAIIIGFDEGYLKLPGSFTPYIPSTRSIQIDYLKINYRLINASPDLIFKPSQNNLTIQFKDPALNEYKFPLKYKLDKWNDQWHDLPLDGQLNFYKLNDGTYNLYINEGNVVYSLLNFTIEPHWYESWLGGLLYTSLALLLLGYLNRRNRKKLILQTQKLQHEKEKEVESEKIKAKNNQLERDLTYKSKMLANSTMALVQKNKMLNELKSVMGKEELSGMSNRQYKQRILNLIDRNINSDEDWEIFEQNFAAVHKDFLDKLKTQFPDITAGDLKLAAYVRMNLSSKEIAPLLNISVRSVENKRYRLRKKMGIVHENNLSSFLLRL